MHCCVRPFCITCITTHAQLAVSTDKDIALSRAITRATEESPVSSIVSCRYL